MLVYALEQCWKVGLPINLQKMPILAKKKKKENILSYEVHFNLGGYVKPAKLSHLGNRKPAYIHWKANTSKTSHFLIQILVQRHNWANFLWKWASRNRYSQWQSLSQHGEQIFVHKNLSAGYWQHLVLNRTALSTKQPKLHSLICALFMNIALSAALSAAEPFGHLVAAIWYRWTIICVMPSKLSATPTSQTQLRL